MIGVFPTPRAPLLGITWAGEQRQVHRRAPGRARILSMAPKLSDLFLPEEVTASRGPLDRAISGIVIDSRRVVPGALFFALPGLRADGATYVDEAIARLRFLVENQ